MSVTMRIFTDRSIVIKWGPSAYDDRTYDSYISIYTKRHLDNCAVNGSRPWPFSEIRIKARNPNSKMDEYIIGNTNDGFRQFCERWLDNPHETEKWAVEEVRQREEKNSNPLVKIPATRRQSTTTYNN